MAADASGFRADFADAYPDKNFDTLTEPQIFGFAQHIPRLVRQKAEMQADLIFLRFAPFLKVLGLGG